MARQYLTQFFSQYSLSLVNRKQLSKRIVSRCIAALAVVSLPLGAVAVQASEQPTGPCTYQCGSNQIRFIPGQPIAIEFINKTDGLIQLERILDVHLPRLMPQTDFTIETLVGVDDDMSLVFWSEDNRAVSAVLHRPDAQTLQVELLPSGHDSDRAVHVSNDGRVLVY